MTVETDPPQETGLIYSAIRYINLALLALGCVFLLLMMAHITVDVIVRYGFNGSMVGTLETVSFYYIVLAVFLPLGYVELKSEHIRVDLFAQMMPNWAQLALYVLACVAGLIFFGMLAWQSSLDAIRSTQRLETIMSNFLFYIWPSRWALPIGFIGMCLAILSNLLRAIQRRQAL
ncbi:TRAP transporter small permease [Roseovarius sp. S4756]|uniref:TRAP transporter small permease n=1 Tax=Roseovarius maritimus TaxID=3342637 RepID=UPI003727B8A1